MIQFQILCSQPCHTNNTNNDNHIYHIIIIILRQILMYPKVVSNSMCIPGCPCVSHPPASTSSTWVIGMPHTTDSKLTESMHVHAPKLSSKVEQAADNFGGKSFGYANRRETLGWAECRMGCQTEPKLQGSKRALWTRSLSCLTPVNIRKEGWRGTDLYLPWLPV